MLDDHRQLQRFSIAVPARIETNSGSTTPPREELFSRDVSSGGAFFLTSHPLDVGTHVVVRMLLHPRRIGQAKGKGAQVTIAGEVLRTDAHGMAVRFHHHFKISSVTV